MPININQPPSQSQEALIQGLESLPPGLARSKKGRSFAETAKKEKPGSRNSEQYPVYTVGLDDLINNGLANAKQISWRYLFPKKNPQEDDIAAEVTYDPEGDNHSFSHTEESDFIGATKVALNKARRLDRSKKHNYELRLLRIPAIYVYALWLKDEKGDEDLFFPVEPTVDSLSGRRAQDEFTNDEFVNIIQQEAQQQGQPPEPPPSSGEETRPRRRRPRQ